jgi:hypothetical protein
MNFLFGTAQVNLDPSEVKEIPSMSDWVFASLQETIRMVENVLTK